MFEWGWSEAGEGVPWLPYCTLCCLLRDGVELFERLVNPTSLSLI